MSATLTHIHGLRTVTPGSMYLPFWHSSSSTKLIPTYSICTCPYPFNPRCVLSLFLFLPLMLVSCLNTYQQWHHGLWCQLLSNTYPSVRERGRKGARYKKSKSGYRFFLHLCVFFSSFLSWQRLGACPLTLTAAQTHRGLHLASVETGRQPLRRLWGKKCKKQFSPIDEQLEKRRSRLWGSESGGRGVDEVNLLC